MISRCALKKERKNSEKHSRKTATTKTYTQSNKKTIAILSYYKCFSNELKKKQDKRNNKIIAEIKPNGQIETLTVNE